jgi:hypothetical protein
VRVVGEVEAVVIGIGVEDDVVVNEVPDVAGLVIGMGHREELSLKRDALRPPPSGR